MEEGENIESQQYKDLIRILENAPPAVEDEILVGQRNIEDAISYLEADQAGVVSGFKPSGPCHFGHYRTINTISNLQDSGAPVYVPVADQEARTESMMETDIVSKAADNLLDWGAVGLDLDDAHVYRQTEEERLVNPRNISQENAQFEDILDVYGLKTLLNEDRGMPFVFAGITQTADICMPQYDDFGQDHSIMVAGSDQDAHMKMATRMANFLIEEDVTSSTPSALYIPHVHSFDRGKASSSEPEGTIYLGSTHENLSLDERIDRSIDKLEENSQKYELGFADGARDHLQILGLEVEDPLNNEEYNSFGEWAANVRDDNEEQRRIVDLAEEFGDSVKEDLRKEIPRFLVDHQERREKVMAYAVDRSEGKNPEKPEFWPDNDRARVPEEERNKTEWHDIVSAMEGEITP